MLDAVRFTSCHCFYQLSLDQQEAGCLLGQSQWSLVDLSPDQEEAGCLLGQSQWSLVDLNSGGVVCGSTSILMSADLLPF